MMLLLSGEGPTDLGSCTMGLPTCENDDQDRFEIGVLTVMLDRLIEPHLGYFLRDIPNSIRYVGKQELSRLAKAQVNPRSVRLRGLRNQAETGFYEIPARILGTLAQELEAERQDPVIAVLFHDSDGTNQTASQDWQLKFDSMLRGFEDANFDKGVPMLPKPKSEAWLICACKNQPYQHCAQLEELSGNDDAPNSAKKVLQDCFAESVNRNSLVSWMESHHFQPEALAAQMHSFGAFLIKLREAISSALSWQPLQANPS